MGRRDLLSADERAKLFGIPVERDALARCYGFGPGDLALIERRREDRNRLGLSLVLTMPERAALALSCNARTHLRAQGRAIASACSSASLVKEGGQAGLALFNQAESADDTWGAPVRAGKRSVSLAG